MNSVADHSSSVSSWHRANQARVENGTFDTSLDQGTYDLVFRSQHASRLGWHILLGVEIGTNAVQLPEVEVQNPRLLTGRVLQGAEVMASAEVRAYASIENDDGSTRDVLIAQVQTDEEGNYLMLLPDSLERR